jgi:hypothetical protein
MLGSRPHHYQFAHIALPRMAEKVGHSLLDTPPPEGLTALLVAAWGETGDRLPAEDRLIGDGLSGEVFDIDGHRMLVVTMPPPLHPPEAYLAALVRPAGSDSSTGLRCFTLELGTGPEVQPTVIGEWVAGGHRNYGPGPEPTVDAFVAALDKLLTH